ncbi:MAG: hypothetical protein A2Y41_01390 [Spirochaetes bacterium GWB1_36_13]|nr:MAG: hypothetical protein A2Y41_01390 [Spirochaetes bacterium GWB1_36_13]
MKEIMENFMKIVEQAKGAQKTIEEEMKKYFEINKKTFEDAAEKMKKQFEDNMKAVMQANDFKAYMDKSLDMMNNFIGTDTIKKMTEMVEQYPFVKEMFKSDFFKTFMPKKETAKK